jgi:hypothetical protein
MTTQSVRLLIGLLLAQFVGAGVLFPFYAFTRQESVGLRVFSVCLALLAAFTIFSVWQRKAWAMWAVLTLVSFKLTLDIFNYALDLDRVMLPLSELINAGVIALAFRAAIPHSLQLTTSQKIFYGCVLALAGWVGFWGMFLPGQVDRALPFMVPPLHARFLGAMYLSGATFMALCLAAREWAEARVVTPMIAIWTGTLGLVSLFHLAAFDWSRTQVWVWFVAYISYPLIAAWIAWQQRTETVCATGPEMSFDLRLFLFMFGGLVTLLAICLLLAPTLMTALWPWKITPLLAHIYSAPFLSYGLGSLLAARQQKWREVRIVIYSTLVFTAGVLLASIHHAGLFDFQTISAWFWFGSLTLFTAGLALFGTVTSLSAQPEQGRSALVSTLRGKVVSTASLNQATPVWWPLRVWMCVEIFFGLAAIATIFLRPQDTATNFAWPIKPDVMAATLGAFYLSSAIIFILPLFARYWQQVRVMIIPTAVFSTMMLGATFLHWDKFSVGTTPFYVWFASYLLPPPVFAALYLWHQRRSAAPGTGLKEPIANGARRFLRINGLGLAGVALLIYLAPSLLLQISPWRFTPLTARTLCGWLIGVGLMQAWMALEGDWQRIRLGTTMLMILPFALLFQLLRFRHEVQWSNVALWLLLLDVGVTAILLMQLWLTAGKLQARAAAG